MKDIIEEFLEFFRSEGLNVFVYVDHVDDDGAIFLTFTNVPDEYNLFYNISIDAVAFSRKQSRATSELMRLDDKIRSLSTVNSGILTTGYVQQSSMSLPVPEYVEEPGWYASSLQANMIFRRI